MKQNRLRFHTVVLLGGVVLMLLPTFTVAWLYTGALQREAEQIVANSLSERGEIAASQIARRLYTTWQMVDRYADDVNPAQAKEVGSQFTLLAQLDDRLSWIGITDVSGKVLASSRGMLEGGDVSQRPWFRSGLAGPFAGDVHDAVLLAKLLGQKDEPLRFVDFAAPIRDENKAVSGVLGVHISWTWLREQIATLDGEGIEVLLVARNRRVLFGPADIEGKILDIGAAVVAGQSETLSRVETWPDGRNYMTAVVPAVQYASMPSFGWSLIVRQDLDAAMGPTRELIRSFWSFLGASTLISLALLSIGARWLAVPLHRLSGFATKLANGTAKEPPYEETRYQEAAELSSALVRLQSMRPNTRSESHP